MTSEWYWELELKHNGGLKGVQGLGYIGAILATGHQRPYKTSSWYQSCHKLKNLILQGSLFSHKSRTDKNILGFYTLTTRLFRFMVRPILLLPELYSKPNCWDWNIKVWKSPCPAAIKLKPEGGYSPADSVITGASHHPRWLHWNLPVKVFLVP